MISELPRPIAVKLCHVISIGASFIMQVKKLGSPPLKKFGGQNMQNLARFHTTSDFNREYLRNDSRYPRSESQLIETDSSRVSRDKSGNFAPLSRKFGV